MEIYDLVIVGGGPVGLFSAFYAGRRRMSTLIIEASEALGGQPSCLYPEKIILDAPGFPQIRGDEISRRLLEQAQSDMLKVKTNTRVTSYKGSLEDGFTVGCMRDNQETFVHTRTLLIATGVGKVMPRRLEVDGEDDLQGSGLHYHVRDPSIMSNRRVVVVGGGDTALDWVEQLEPVAADIHLVHRRDQFRAQEASIHRLSTSRTTVHLNAEVRRVMGDGRVQHLHIQYKDGRDLHLPCDDVVVAFGHRIELGDLNHWGLNLEKGYVTVNDSMETNIPGIFAAGDVTCAPGIGNTKLLAIGFAQGTVAVNTAKIRLDPKAGFFPGHSTNWG